MKKLFCFRGGTVARRSERAPMAEWMTGSWRSRTSTRRLSAITTLRVQIMVYCGSWLQHYLVIPIEHIPTVNNLQRTTEDHQLVSHMLAVGRDLLNRDAPNSEEHRFGFHQPPFNSVDHLHLHCLALPFTPSWRQVKYTPLGPLGGFIEVESLLERIRP
uniref:HIT domain-containing protein n=1 Tax=Oryza barthii TaxID=65489 RepID=A0A0D3FYD2_9ORYZ